MVLKANSAAAAPAPATTEVKSVGAFEPMDEETSSQVAANEPAPAPAAAAPAPAPAAPAPAPAQPAKANVPAVQQGGRLAVSDGGVAAAFAQQVLEMKGAVDFSFGNFKVFKGVSGGIATTDGQLKLGRWAHGTMAAWDEHWEVSPGSKSDKSKGAVAYSADGKTIDSVVDREKYGQWVGKSPAEYVKWLQNDGDYPQAKYSRYVDLAFMVDQSDNGELIGEVIQVTLSQSSIPSFSSYQEKLKTKAMLIKRGMNIAVPDDPFTFYLVAEAVSKDGNNWTKVNVMDRLPTKL